MCFGPSATHQRGQGAVPDGSDAATSRLAVDDLLEGAATLRLSVRGFGCPNYGDGLIASSAALCWHGLCGASHHLQCTPELVKSCCIGSLQVVSSHWTRQEMVQFKSWHLTELEQAAYGAFQQPQMQRPSAKTTCCVCSWAKFVCVEARSILRRAGYATGRC